MILSRWISALLMVACWMTSPELVEVGLVVQRVDGALEPFAVVGRAEVVETRCGAGAFFEFVGGERHR